MRAGKSRGEFWRSNSGSSEIYERDWVVMNDDLIMGLDPSSTVVGYAFKSFVSVGLNDYDSGLVEAGLIRPDMNRVDGPESFWRICSMREYLSRLLDEKGPKVILIEWTKGKVGRRRHRGDGAGLAVYGCGLGAVATECMHWAVSHGCQVVPILENDWTRGVPKADRQAAIASEYQQYDPAADPGGDIADAIGLTDWWLKERMIRI
jgi:hypothetical protein